MTPILALFIKPHLFFNKLSNYSKPLYLFCASWLYGVFHTIDRIDRHLLKESLDRPWPGWALMEPIVNAPWHSFWLLMLTIGLPAGGIAYYLGGWWYKVRLNWAGAKTPHIQIARYLHIYIQLVMSIPSLLVVLVQTFIYVDYRSAWQGDIFILTVLTVFPFWSCYTSYYVASRVCEANRKKALLLFVIMPCSLYILAYISLWQAIEHLM